MSQNSPVYVFDKQATDFTTTGLVGDLRPLEAIFHEEKNGISEVVIKLPYDELKRWKAASVGNIIKCLVPVRVPPVINDNEYANSVEITEASE